MTTKQEILREYGIEVLDGNSLNIFLVNDGKKIPYNTNNFLFFSTEYFVKDVLKIFDLDKHDIDKTTLLKQYGIEVGSVIGDTIELKKNDLLLKYKYIDYKHLDLSSFMTDMFILFSLTKDDIIKNDIKLSYLEDRELKELNLAERSEYIRKSLNQLRITKCWIGSNFFLQRGEKRIQFSFEKFINTNKELLISDIVNKFNNFDKSEVKSNIDLIINNVDSIFDKKEKIKQILKEKGYYDK